MSKKEETTIYLAVRYTNEVNAFSEIQPIKAFYSEKEASKEVKRLNSQYAKGVILENNEFVDTDKDEYNYYDIEELPLV